ncbi:hypothetical protein D2U88_04820 [Flagellimonas aequoris]|uniref:Oligosaccharide repeat unit polymerase n=2 Tax=Flagellimonas aequoris TaxID=2306997 RepID=A0A418NAS1_9FLAO|nr:hypothetical protein D2U88_04820 [Allomuricauda aequoris]
MRLTFYKYKSLQFTLAYYILLSILNFNYIIHANSFVYVAYNTESVFEFLPYRFFFVTTIILINCIVLSFHKISDFAYSVLLLILIFFVIPAGLIYASNRIILSDIFIFNNLLFYVSGLFLSIKVNIPTPVINGGQAAQLLISITAVGIIPFIYLYAPYINLKNLLLIDVYETRALVTENVDNTYTAYTYSWYSKIILPIILVFFIHFKSRLGLIISFGFLMFFYLCGAHKTVFLGTFAVLVFYRYDYLKKTYFLLKVLCTIAVLGLLLQLFFNWDYFWTITLNRIFMLNALLDYCFFDFFRDKPIYWADSFLASSIQYPYELMPSHLIGKEYLSNPNVNANSGIIANGYKNAGIIGVLINIVFVSIYLGMLNSFRISPKFYGLFIVLIFTFTNASLTGSILTHGLLILFVVSMFVLRNTKYSLT